MTDRKKKFYCTIFAINIIFILFLVGYYGYRLVYYYQAENKKEGEITTFHDHLTQGSNLVVKKDGLHQDGKEYRYVGKQVSNYVSYSGYLFRIVKIMEDGSITLIMDQSYTNLSWGEKKDYHTSYLRDYLSVQNGKEHTGIFSSTLYQVQDLLKETAVCTDTIDNVKKITCKNKTSDMVGLIGLEDFQKSGGVSGYLNNGESYWISNRSKSGNYYISATGSLNENEILNHSHAYGIRPVITLKPSVVARGGSGSKEDPYMIEQHAVTTLQDAYVGKYIRYSGSTFRILSKDGEKVRVVLSDTLQGKGVPLMKYFSKKSNLYNPKEYGSLAHYLNTTYVKTLSHPEYLVEGTIYRGVYGAESNYDYKSIYNNVVTAKIGLIQAGDPYLKEHPNTFILNGSGDDMIYTLNEQGKFFLDDMTKTKQIRPVLNLILTAPIQGGDGGLENPYIVGEV